MPGTIVPNRRPVTGFVGHELERLDILKGRYILRQPIFLTLWRHGVA